MKVSRRRKAQSILELAIFGSILIMLLGNLLEYGLRYNFQQKMEMTAFRKALKKSGKDGAGGMGSYTIIQDKHIPDPSNPFAVGQVMPFSSSASVVRNPALDETPDYPKKKELPRTYINIANKELNYTTAGYRVITEEYDNATSTEPPNLEKYQEIYGFGNAYINGSRDDLPKGPTCVLKTDDGKTCLRWSADIIVIDSCEGQMMNYDSCKRQCRLITNTTFCKDECRKGRDEGQSKCGDICNHTIELPWYCQRDADNVTALDKIFSFAIAHNKPKVMGVQSDYEKTTTGYNTLHKQEAAGRINTTDTINWSDTTQREIVYMDKDINQVHREQVNTTVSENTTWTCANGICH